VEEEPGEQPYQETTGDVHGERSDREIRVEGALHRAAEEVTRDTSGRATQGDQEQNHRASENRVQKDSCRPMKVRQESSAD
jgi:hypothetical protein